MHHSSRRELDDDKGEERAKEEIGDLQKVTGPDVRRVIVQECRPVLLSWLWCTNGSHVLLNGALAHVDAEFQSIAPDPFSSPQSILRGHLPNQGNGFRSSPWRMRSGL
jgi:hypothetical protein